MYTGTNNQPNMMIKNIAYDQDDMKELRKSFKIWLWNRYNLSTFIYKYTLILTLNSKAAIPMPEAAPVPAKPMKCPEPILLANNDAPTW